MEKRNDTRRLVLYALFVALIFLLGLTPLGYIYLPIAAITTVHIPVIVGAVGATQRLTDGTMVSVDCARGVVQTLPQ